MYVRCYSIYRMCKDTVYMHVHMHVRYHRIYRICKHTVYDMCTCMSVLHLYVLFSCVWWMHCYRYPLFQIHTAWSFTVLGPLVWKQFVLLVIEDSCLLIQSSVWYSLESVTLHLFGFLPPLQGLTVWLMLACSWQPLPLASQCWLQACTILAGFGSPVREAAQLDFVII